MYPDSWMKDRHTGRVALRHYIHFLQILFFNLAPAWLSFFNNNFLHCTLGKPKVVGSSLPGPIYSMGSDLGFRSSTPFS